MSVKQYDFAGWATRNDVRCSDGRVIMQDAFADQDGKSVPLVWNHNHSSVDNVLGHAMLQNRDEGVYAYCYFNDTPAAQKARELVKHGDITSLSIYANQLKHNGTNVMHGIIREVSMVLAGANPEAFIDSVLTHSDNGSDIFADDATIYMGLPLEHSALKSDDELKDPDDDTDGDSDDDTKGKNSKSDSSVTKKKNDSEGNSDSSDSEEDDESTESSTRKKKRPINVSEDKSSDVADVLGSDSNDKSDDKSDDDNTKDDKDNAMSNSMRHSDDDRTVADVINGMTDKQKAVAFYVIKQALAPYDISFDGFDDDDDDDDDDDYDKQSKSMKHAATNNSSDSDETVGDVLDTLTDEQMNVIKYIIGQVLEDNGITADDVKKVNSGSTKEDDSMSHNVFDRTTDPSDTLMHNADCDFAAMVSDMRQYGKLSQSMLAHGVDLEDFSMSDYLAHADYGMENIDVMFPDAKAVANQPFMITRDLNWVPGVMGAVSHTPFARIKSIAADLTEDDARAKGYLKGKLKKEEVFSLLKRVTTPTTVYKKQKLDREDIISITDFDVIVWLKAEMRTMLDEEIARAILISDGRSASAEDKISESCIRPIWTDDSVYTIKSTMKFTAAPSEAELAAAVVDQAVLARKDYRGSGNPALFTTEDMLTRMLLMKDTLGHRLYKTEEELATAMRVSKIYTVPQMENLTRTPATGETTLTGKKPTLDGIIVNLKDYTVGTDKGGAVSMFDDFDIDYNQQKYLIETHISGALTTPYSAIVIEHYVEPGK